MIAKFNAIAKARKEMHQHHHAGGPADTSTDSARRRDPDATDFHAIVYINDYPQKARWKVTNKDTMSQLVETTGASIANKGNYYEPGKEPGPGELPKLHLLIESNEENKVSQNGCDWYSRWTRSLTCLVFEFSGPTCDFRDQACPDRRRHPRVGGRAAQPRSHQPDW